MIIYNIIFGLLIISAITVLSIIWFVLGSIFMYKDMTYKGYPHTVDGQNEYFTHNYWLITFSMGPIGFVFMILDILFPLYKK